MNQTPLEQDPAVYLRQQPSPISPCHLLVEQLESHDGDHTPMHMLAKVAVRLHSFAAWAARWDARERLARRAAGALAGLAIANIGVVIAWWLHAHDARIVAEAEARASAQVEIEYRRGVKEQMERMEQDIRDLRRDLRRMSGAKPGPDGGVVAIGAP